MNVAIVFWSGTGNTEAMAEILQSAIKENGNEAELISASSFNAQSVSAYDALAFGCPAMGSEVLEEDEFEPMFSQIESSLSGKKVALFGSYGWGDGEWMREWESRTEADGAKVVGTVIANGEPDDTAVNELKNLGGALVE